MNTGKPIFPADLVPEETPLAFGENRLRAKKKICLLIQISMQPNAAGPFKKHLNWALGMMGSIPCSTIYIVYRQNIDILCKDEHSFKTIPIKSQDRA
jgi:hypothetical protein